MMRPLLVVTPVTVLVGLLGGCPPAHVPGPADTAASLGLVDGAIQTYAVSGNVTETHEIKRSSILPDPAENADGVVFDILAKQNGFAVDDRTFSVEVALKSVKLVRFFDCITRCGQPSAPIAMFDVPLKSGGSDDNEVDVALLRNGNDDGAAHEKHNFLVGDEATFTTPAGDFDAFTVSWTRTQTDAAAPSPETSLLRIAPDTGIVGWTGFDGAELKLQ